MSDPICPFARQHILHGEEDRRRTIIPIGTAAHTAVTTANGDSLGRYFDADAVKDDSTFYNDRDGTLTQFGPVDRQANAQFSGNAFKIGSRWFGMVSIEHWDGGDPSRPLTVEQIASDIKLYAWLHTEWGISLDVSTAWNGPGAGWHSKYPEWNHNAHACPGPVRVKQLVEVILPGARKLLAPAPPAPTLQEDLMAITFRDPRTKQVFLVDGGKRLHLDRPQLTALQQAGAVKGEPVESLDLARLFDEYPTV